MSNYTKEEQQQFCSDDAKAWDFILKNEYVYSDNQCQNRVLPENDSCDTSDTYYVQEWKPTGPCVAKPQSFLIRAMRDINRCEEHSHDLHGEAGLVAEYVFLYSF